ncbi:hypothetical protein SNEBB_005371 [Seison nebaliae]|nr:hypothetical protein SNEBB_005371 [Seison nebaliae]
MIELGQCPRCGQNICPHTSVYDLPMLSFETSSIVSSLHDLQTSHHSNELTTKLLSSSIRNIINQTENDYDSGLTNSDSTNTRIDSLSKENKSTIFPHQTNPTNRKVNRPLSLIETRYSNHQINRETNQNDQISPSSISTSSSSQSSTISSMTTKKKKKKTTTKNDNNHSSISIHSLTSTIEEMNKNLRAHSVMNVPLNTIRTSYPIFNEPLFQKQTNNKNIHSTFPYVVQRRRFDDILNNFIFSDSFRVSILQKLPNCNLTFQLILFRSIYFLLRTRSLTTCTETIQLCNNMLQQCIQSILTLTTSSTNHQRKLKLRNPSTSDYYSLSSSMTDIHSVYVDLIEKKSTNISDLTESTSIDDSLSDDLSKQKKIRKKSFTKLSRLSSSHKPSYPIIRIVNEAHYSSSDSFSSLQPPSAVDPSSHFHHTLSFLRRHELHRQTTKCKQDITREMSLEKTMKKSKKRNRLIKDRLKRSLSRKKETNYHQHQHYHHHQHHHHLLPCTHLKRNNSNTKHFSTNSSTSSSFYPSTLPAKNFEKANRKKNNKNESKDLCHKKIMKKEKRLKHSTRLNKTFIQTSILTSSEKVAVKQSPIPPYSSSLGTLKITKNIQNKSLLSSSTISVNSSNSFPYYSLPISISSSSNSNDSSVQLNRFKRLDGRKDGIDYTNMTTLATFTYILIFFFFIFHLIDFTLDVFVLFQTINQKHLYLLILTLIGITLPNIVGVLSFKKKFSFFRFWQKKRKTTNNFPQQSFDECQSNEWLLPQENTAGKTVYHHQSLISEQSTDNLRTPYGNVSISYADDDESVISQATSNNRLPTTLLHNSFNGDHSSSIPLYSNTKLFESISSKKSFNKILRNNDKHYEKHFDDNKYGNDNNCPRSNEHDELKNWKIWNGFNLLQLIPGSTFVASCSLYLIYLIKQNRYILPYMLNMTKMLACFHSIPLLCTQTYLMIWNMHTNEVNTLFLIELSLSSIISFFSILTTICFGISLAFTFVFDLRNILLSIYSNRSNKNVKDLSRKFHLQRSTFKKSNNLHYINAQSISISPHKNGKNSRKKRRGNEDTKSTLGKSSILIIKLITLTSASWISRIIFILTRWIIVVTIMKHDIFSFPVIALFLSCLYIFNCLMINGIKNRRLAKLPIILLQSFITFIDLPLQYYRHRRLHQIHCTFYILINCGTCLSLYFYDQHLFDYLTLLFILVSNILVALPIRIAFFLLHRNYCLTQHSSSSSSSSS